MDYLINRCRSLIFSTAGSPLTIAAALHAVQTIRRDGSRRDRLHQNATHLRERLVSVHRSRATDFDSYRTDHSAGDR